MLKDKSALYFAVRSGPPAYKGYKPHPNGWSISSRVTEILNGRRAITGDTALRLAHFFGTTAQFWLNLQSLFDLRVAQKKTGKSIRRLPTLKHLEQARV